MKKLVLLVLMMFVSLGYADTLYVKSKRAKLRKHPRKKKTVEKAKRGESMTKLKKVKKWIRVNYKGKKLWIYKGKVSKKNPQPDPSLAALSKSPEDIAAGSAVRGLSEVALEFSKENKVSEKHKTFMDYHQSYISTEKSDLAAEITSKKVKPVAITPDMLEKFQEDGKIGAFAEAGDDSEFEEN